MCGRFTLHTTGQALARFFLDASLDVAFPDLKPRFNIAPSQLVATVRMQPNQNAEFAPMRWGLIPAWAKDTKIGYKMINARSETLAEKPSFRTALKRRRCLIPADGFYEWLTDGRAKRPFFMHRPENQLFAFAGLWETWSREEQPIESTTIITTSANSFLSDLHHRMPVIVAPERFQEWLDPNADETKDWSDFFRPVEDEYFERHEVATTVNSPRNEGPECIEESSGFLF
ncbi:MAG: SOS response-associated peptidase [Pirellulaceae bacterium]